MPTFKEYRAKVIAESVQASQAGVSPGQLKKNVASQECGAKALAWNPEAKDVAAILSDNRDNYMKNLCSASKWVELELCEPVQLRKLELVNYELFSSAFKEVRLLASDSYPAREWQAVANFTLNASRAAQQFDLHTHNFVQFVRLTFADHYGSEHFCTLTHLRLLGVLASDIVEGPGDADGDAEEAAEAPNRPVNASGSSACSASQYHLWLLRCSPDVNFGPQPAPSQPSLACQSKQHACGYFGLFHRPLRPQAPPGRQQNDSGNGHAGGYAPLANKIKQMQQNVSVSMRYLEELSLAYNRQMQRLSLHFNATLRKLQETAKFARRRDREQAARIRLLERRLESSLFAQLLCHCAFFGAQLLALALCCRRQRPALRHRKRHDNNNCTECCSHGRRHD